MLTYNRNAMENRAAPVGPNAVAKAR